MDRNYKNGQFIGKTKKGYAPSILDLPQGNREVIQLYQDHNVLPKFEEGVRLEIKTLESRLGDQINEGLTFYNPETKTYPSVRPILASNDKLPLVLTNKILYKLLINIPHTAIAQELGWVYKNYNDDVKINMQPITRIRSNKNFFSFCFQI